MNTIIPILIYLKSMSLIIAKKGILYIELGGGVGLGLTVGLHGGEHFIFIMNTCVNMFF